jgi:hypothetical protein
VADAAAAAAYRDLLAACPTLVCCDDHEFWNVFPQLVEYRFEEIQLDLTPGANDRNSAPEHLWNGARWWSDAFGELDRPISGRYVIRDPHCAVLGPGEL